MKAGHLIALAIAASGVTGCATTTASGPVDVTRYHLGAPLERGTITVEPMPGGGSASLEFKTYAAAVETELLKVGYAPPAMGKPAQYLGVVSFTRTTRETGPRSAPFTVGVGGGTGSGNVGIGGGIGIPIGKPRANEVALTELSVQIRRRGDGTVIWEGRAQTAADVRAPEAQASLAAGKLANALFQGFPGESGRTITVR